MSKHDSHEESLLKARGEKKEKRQNAPLAKTQKYKYKEIHRSEIKNAPYNPRQIDDHARKKLQLNLKKKGLMAPLVWNKRTGNLVSGHQRLAIVDALEGSANYKLGVAVVSLSEKDEKEQNIFFNNPSAMGTWDIDLLGEMLTDKKSGVDYKATGFDDMDLQMLFDDTAYATTMFDMQDAPQAVKENVASLEDIQKMKRARKEYREGDIKENDSEFYAVVVFPNRQAQGRFMERIGLSSDDRYVDGVRLYSSLEAIKPPTKGEFVEDKFWISKEQKKIVDAEITRISSLIEGKNIRGRALEYMAVNSSQTPIDNIVGENAADISSEEDNNLELTRKRRKDKKRRKKEKRMRDKLKVVAHG